MRPETDRGGRGLSNMWKKEKKSPSKPSLSNASDLDVNRHMNNLHYIAMFQDACDSSFWRDFSPKEMEICFMSQCKEGEAISVRSKMTGDAVHFAALHQNGQIASVADFRR